LQSSDNKSTWQIEWEVSNIPSTIIEWPRDTNPSSRHFNKPLKQTWTASSAWDVSLGNWTVVTFPAKKEKEWNPSSR